MIAAPLFAASALGADSTLSHAEIWTPRTETGRIHLHGGLFAPIGGNATSTTFGGRLGINLGSHMLMGVMADWSFESKSLTQPVPSDLPGLKPKEVLAKVDAQLIPAMGYVQLKLTDKFPVVPYGGIGAGYEWLILRAIDHRNGASAHSTYANWAWQSYAGLGLRLSRGLRFDSELFYNGAWLTRDVKDVNGITSTEGVDVRGVGARIGVDILY
ncbi:MAG: hypothetical protein ACRENS_09915 [Candidatus Eiseniibacteriota bacterium]